MAPHSSTFVWKIPWTEEPGGLQSMGLLGVRHDWATSLSLFTFHFPALEKEMATHSSVLAWRIPGTGKPGGLPSMRSHRVGHDWSDLTAAAVAVAYIYQYVHIYVFINTHTCKAIKHEIGRKKVKFQRRDLGGTSSRTWAYHPLSRAPSQRWGGAAMKPPLCLTHCVLCSTHCVL